MSTVSRLISGSAASWARIGVTTVSQLVLVPVYLSYWSVETYGVWLAILALVSMLSMLDYGHQTFLEFEFLRIGKKDLQELRIYLWSGVWVGGFINIAQIMLVLILLATDVLPFLLGESDLQDKTVIHAAGIVLLIQSIAWLISKSISGLFGRALSPFGYYPRMAWWRVFNALISTIAPIVAVIAGAGLIVTGIVGALVTVAGSIPQYIDMFRLLNREKIIFIRPSLKLGYQNFTRSMGLSVNSLLENARHQGARLVLVPLAGATGLAAFSTMRTGANVALQGLNTITNPLMPELMRFLHQRDQMRSEGAFGTVWIVVVALMAPALVVLQVFIEPLYSLWTRGQIPFDPLLFAVLSLSILVYAVAQPAIAVVRGNNLVKPQLIISIIAATTVVGGICLLVPLIGILGGGVALLAAEVIATIAYRIVAQNWLQQNQLIWPSRPALIANMSVWIAAAAMGGVVWLPQAKWIVLLITLLLLFWNLIRYWQILPSLATQQAKKLLGNLPGIKKVFAT